METTMETETLLLFLKIAELKNCPSKLLLCTSQFLKTSPSLKTRQLLSTLMMVNCSLSLPTVVCCVPCPLLCFLGYAPFFA